MVVECNVYTIVDHHLPIILLLIVKRRENTQNLTIYLICQ